MSRRAHASTAMNARGMAAAVIAGVDVADDLGRFEAARIALRRQFEDVLRTDPDVAGPGPSVIPAPT